MDHSIKKLISDIDNFNNFQALVSTHHDAIISLFNSVVDSSFTPDEFSSVRLYGEIFGGKYGGLCDQGAVRTQKDPNYCSTNDFAFFDIIVDGITVPVLQAHELINKSGLKVAPVIYTGPLAPFLKTFNVNTFSSVVSQEFYGMPFLNTDRATEGVTIRTTNTHPDEAEQTIIKYKQTWAAENPRINKHHKIKDERCDDIVIACLDMLNDNRIASYNSKNTLDDMTNPRLIGTHVKEIVEDTMKDITEEFPVVQYPNLNYRNVSQHSND
jgi:hypothetical protein